MNRPEDGCWCLQNPRPVILDPADDRRLVALGGPADQSLHTPAQQMPRPASLGDQCHRWPVTHSTSFLLVASDRGVHDANSTKTVSIR